MPRFTHDECIASEGTDKPTLDLPTTTRSKWQRFGLRTLLIVTMTICILLAIGRWGVRKGQESHARSCLRTISELADDTIHMSIPQQHYRKAIGAAAYIKLYYPPGAVLPKDHPFAREYEAERQRQIQRIHDALRTAVGDEHPTVWREWNEAVDEIVIVFE